MMLLRIFFLALIVFLILWAFLEWTKYKKGEGFLSKSIVERFEEESVPPLPEVLDIPPPPANFKVPTAGDLLMASFQELPQEEQVVATETRRESNIDLSKTLADYTSTRDPVALSKPIVVTNQSTQFSRQTRPRAKPTKPLWLQLRERREQKNQSMRNRLAQNPPKRRVTSIVPAMPPPPDKKTVEYSLMMSELENNAYNTCYIDNCQPLEEYIKETCTGFTPECTIQELQNIENCMYSYLDRCDEGQVEECKQYCRDEWTSKTTKMELEQDDFISSNERITSERGSTVLVLRDTGEIELYYNQELVWTSNSSRSEIGGGADKGPFTLRMHGNGDLVLSNGLGMEVWHSNTWMDVFGAGFMNAPFVMTVGDGEFYIQNKSKDIIWKNTSSIA